MPKPKELTPELRDEICIRFAETLNASEVSRATGVSDYRVRRIWDGLTAGERERYTALVQQTVQAAAATVLERQADEVAAYASGLLRVRSKALNTLERMLDAVPAEDPKYFFLLKEIGKVLRDLHEMASDSGDASRSASAEEFYRQLKSPSTINIQNNYYGKKSDKHPDPGDRPVRVG